MAGLLALTFGGHVFHVLVAVICGLMMWELVRMVAPLNAPLALQLGTLSALASFIAIYIPTGFGLPLSYFALHAVAMQVEAILSRRDRPINRTPWIGRLWTIGWVVLPLPILFHLPSCAAVSGR